ncbi:MAG: hypothetical protein ACSNEK_06160 [Parachlamydiaceae bacterium]
MENLLFTQWASVNNHAVIFGMTDSGKTGLEILILEEAAIDGFQH